MDDPTPAEIRCYRLKRTPDGAWSGQCPDCDEYHYANNIGVSWLMVIHAIINHQMTKRFEAQMALVE